jgi:hypothetical protein
MGRLSSLLGNTMGARALKQQPRMSQVNGPSPKIREERRLISPMRTAILQLHVCSMVTRHKNVTKSGNSFQIDVHLLIPDILVY